MLQQSESLARVHDDRSHGYEAVASDFMASRSREIGVAELRRWARQLRQGAAILDLGCGHGEPVARLLVESGFALYGIDASPTLVAEFQRRWPEAAVRCEDVRTSALYGRKFDGIVAIGLLFLFTAAEQLELLRSMANALLPGGGILVTAPPVACTWHDSLTGQLSRSLGAAAYAECLVAAGLELTGEFDDAGGNHYFEARRPPRGTPDHARR